MNTFRKGRALALAALLAAVAVPTLPALGQDNSAEARLRRLEAEVRALQRQVFPGADGRIFTPEIERQPSTPQIAGTPATSAVTDLLARMEALEGSLTRITAQGEENANKIAQLQRQLAALETSAAAAAAEAAVPAASANLSAMSGGASQPAPTPRATPTPAPTPRATPTPRPNTPAAAAPSAARLAAVRAIVKPKTDDPGDDDYSYGFRLWEAKFYPEAQQQLRLFLDKYPRHPRVSYARNLLGRAYLDEGKPRDAATWFLQNYNADKTGARAPDSLLLLADAMARLNDTNRACIALNGFRQEYPLEAAGRLKDELAAVRAKVKCN